MDTSTNPSETNTVSLETPGSSSLELTKLRRNSTIQWVIITILMLGILLLGIYIIVNNNRLATLTSNNSTQNNVPKTGDNSDSVDSNSNKENTDNSAKETIFTSSDIWFNDQPYPSELTTLLKSSTRAVTCGDIYTSFGTEDGRTFTSERDQSNLTDEDTIAFASSINPGGRLFQIRKCRPEPVSGLPSGTFYLYNYCNTSCGGGISTVHGVGFYNSVAQDAVEFNNTTGAYPQCLEVLAYTSDKKIYINCEAGDGGSSSEEIYKVDLTEHKATSIVKEAITSEM